MSDKHPGGRPTDYSDELVLEFCRRVASGRSVFAVCSDLDMPSDTTVYRWQQEKPQFRDSLTRARDERLESYADRMDALARRVIEEQSLDPQRVNAAVNAIDKAARLQMPRQRVELTGANGGPVQTENPDDRALALAVASIIAKGQKGE